MGFRYRKSTKITKGIKVNVNKNSTSVTLGSGMMKHTINSNGKVTRSVSIPNTGVYHTETIKPENKSKNRKQEKEYSPAVYKAASISAIVWGFMCLFLGLLFTFIIPPLGILISIFGISCFFISGNFRKKAKQAKEKQIQRN